MWCWLKQLKEDWRDAIVNPERTKDNIVSNVLKRKFYLAQRIFVERGDLSSNPGAMNETQSLVHTVLLTIYYIYFLLFYRGGPDKGVEGKRKGP